MPTPIDINGLISAGVSTLGNIFGNTISYGQAQRLQTRQFDYNKQLMQMQQDYNSPVNQMSLYRKAGINPNAALGHNTSISAGSVGAPSVSPFNLGSEAIGNYIAGSMQPVEKQKLINETQKVINEGKKIDADTLSVIKDIDNKEMQNNILMHQSDALKEREDIQNLILMTQRASLEAQTTYNTLLAVGQNTLNLNQQKIIDQQLANDVAQNMVLLAQQKLTIAQAKSAMEAAYYTAAQRQGQHLNNQIISRSVDSLVNSNEFKSQLDKLNKDYRQKQVDYYEVEKALGSASGIFNVLKNLAKARKGK